MPAGGLEQPACMIALTVATSIVWFRHECTVTRPCTVCRPAAVVQIIERRKEAAEAQAAEAEREEERKRVQVGWQTPAQCCQQGPCSGHALRRVAAGFASLINNHTPDNATTGAHSRIPHCQNVHVPVCYACQVRPAGLFVLDDRQLTLCMHTRVPHALLCVSHTCRSSVSRRCWRRSAAVRRLLVVRRSVLSVSLRSRRCRRHASCWSRHARRAREAQW